MKELNVSQRMIGQWGESTLNSFNEQVLSDICDSLNIVIWSFDCHRKSLQLSAGYETIFQLSREEAFNNPQLWREKVHPLDKHKIFEREQEMNEAKSTYYEFRIVDSDGSITWIEDYAVPTFDTNGQLIRYDGFIVDITRQKKIEQQLKESEQKYESLFKYNTDGIMSFDLNGKFTNSNSAVEKIAGYTCNSLIGQSYEPLIYSEDSEKAFYHFNQAIKGIPQHFQLRIIHKNGAIVEIEVTSIPIVINREIVGVYAIVKDRTEEKRQQEELINTMKKLESIYSTLDVVTWEADPINRKVFVSANVESVIGLSTKDFEENPNKINDIIHPDDRQRVREWQIRINNGKKEQIDYRIIDKEGNVRWLQDLGVPILNDSGKVIKVQGIAFDNTKRKMAEQKVHQLAYYDHLTDLPNRARLKELWPTWLKKEARNKQYALIAINLDRFKLINDTLSMEQGDQVLIDMTQRLKQYSNDDDECLFRLNGDEFILVTQYIGDVELHDLAESILYTLKEPYMLEGHPFYITASIGISVSTEADRDIDPLLQRADVALYYVKQAGGNSYRLFHSDMMEALKKKVTLEKELREAIKNDELELFYQPQLNIVTGELTGLEALVRWRHPSIGLVPPNDFIPLAEETGLIIPLGEWVLREACRQTKQWQDKGYPLLVVSVNLSPIQLSYNFTHVLETILHETGLQAEYLELEITESIIQNEDISKKLFNDVKAIGVNVSIDDFGTGYSSLSYLKHLPITQLKIDRSFIKDITSSKTDEAIVESVVNICKTLNIDVIAEGIETENHLNILKQLGCQKGQGYLFSPPVQVKEVEQILENHNTNGLQ